MLRGAAKLGLGVGRMGLGVAGAAMTPLMIPMAALSTVDLLEKAGFDPTGSQRRTKAPYRGAALEEALLEGIDEAQAGNFERAMGQADNFDDDLMKLLMRSGPRLQAASVPVDGQAILHPVSVGLRRGLL